MSGEFLFEMRAAFRRDDPYFYTRWDQAQKVEVVARTKQEAINKADAMLGGSHSYRHWVFRVDRVRDVRAVAALGEKSE